MAASQERSGEEELDEQMRERLARAYETGEDDVFSRECAAGYFRERSDDPTLRLPVRLPESGDLLLSVETDRFERTRIISKSRVLTDSGADCDECGHEYAVEGYWSNGVESGETTRCHACGALISESSTL